MATLLYHSTPAAVSPFDEAVLKVAQTGVVRIVSPYIGMAYLERIIGASTGWRLLSDVQEWLASSSQQARPRAWQFIRNNIELIHHCPALHAKAVISDSLAMMGSANLTQMGMLGRNEMGILLDDPKLVAELGSWFDTLWSETAPPQVDETSAYVQWLDEEASQSPARRQRVTLSSSSRKVRARLAKLEVAGKPKAGPLDLSEVAHAIIIKDQTRYESLESAIEAAIEVLTQRGDFGLGDVVSEVHAGFAGGTLREIYFLLVQHCANHVRSVFAETTQNRLVLQDGRFRQSSRETLEPALVPFDGFLVYLTAHLDFHQAIGLPLEAQIAQETGVRERDQVVLVSELLDSGFLVLDDLPGELPHCSLEPEFEWAARYALFPRAHAAWNVKRQNDVPVSVASEPDEREFDAYRTLRELPEKMEDSDSSYNADSITKGLREGAEIRRQRRQKKEQEEADVDAALSLILGMMARGVTFRALNRYALVKWVSKSVGVHRDIVAKALSGSYAPVFLVTGDGPMTLELNPELSIVMLQNYPKALAVSAELLKQR